MTEKNSYNRPLLVHWECLVVVVVVGIGSYEKSRVVTCRKARDTI